MNIKQYLYTLIKQRREGDSSPELVRRIAYARAYMLGEEALDNLRDRWIEAEIAKKYSGGAENRITINYVKDQTNAKYLAEFNEHEAYAEECKAKIDEENYTYKMEVESWLQRN